VHGLASLFASTTVFASAAPSSLSAKIRGKEKFSLLSNCIKSQIDETKRQKNCSMIPQARVEPTSVSRRLS
jgi:hypothetical protein